MAAMLGMMGPYWYEELVEVAEVLGHGDVFKDEEPESAES